MAGSVGGGGPMGWWGTFKPPPPLTHSIHDADLSEGGGKGGKGKGKGKGKHVSIDMPDATELPRGLVKRQLFYLNRLVANFIAVVNCAGRTLAIMWSTTPLLAATMLVLTLVSGGVPTLVAYLGRLIVDSVVKATSSESPQDRTDALRFVGWEALAVLCLALSTRTRDLCQHMIRVLLGHEVNVIILHKASKMELPNFEDSELYDKMTQAWREASSRPYELINHIFALIKDIISLCGFAFLIYNWSAKALAVLMVGGIPNFICETQFAGTAFRIFARRSAEYRWQIYFEQLLTKLEFIKEIKLLTLEGLLIDRYKQIFLRIFAEDKVLTTTRYIWNFVFFVLSTATVYMAYFWIVWEALAGNLTLGQMTMLMAVFKQGQTALTHTLASTSGIFEDYLYVSNLFGFLDGYVDEYGGAVTQGEKPGDGVTFEDVSFTYPGCATPALSNVSFRIRPGEKLALVGENGSGKTTITKLLAGLYHPTSGTIYLDGTDLSQWKTETLRSRISCIFQDFNRYNLTVGDNIGVGDIDNLDDREQWHIAAEKGLARPLIEGLPHTYDTQLGRMFQGGQDLSGGQWQKVALARSFMRKNADIMVLDEPTAAMDAGAEIQVFEHFKNQTATKQMLLLISHRFSTVRIADHIIVIEKGCILERGNHQELMGVEKGIYAGLFTAQAAGYR